MSSAPLAEAYVAIRSGKAEFLSELSEMQSRFTSTIHQMTTVAGGMLEAAGIGKLVEQLKELGHAFISTNADMEQYTVAWSVLLGSRDKAKAFIDDIEKMASTTPFHMEGLLKAAQLMKTFGFSASEIPGILRTVGDAAAASPDGMEEGMQHITRELGLMLAKGKVTSREMIGLTTAGIPVWDMLAKKIGVSVPQAMKQAESGAISSRMAISAILEGISERFGGMTNEQSKTWKGMVTTIVDNWRIVIREVGKPIFDVLENKQRQMIAMFADKSFQSWVHGVAEGFQRIIDLIGTALQSPLAEAVGKVAAVAAGVVGIGVAFTGVSAIAGGLAAVVGAVLSPIGLLIVGATALGVAFRDALNGEWGDSLRESLSGIGTLFAEVYTNVREGMGNLAAFIGGAWNKLFGSELPAAQAGMAKSFLDFIHRVADGLSLLTTDFNLTWEYMKTGLALVLTQMADKAYVMFNTFKAAAMGAGAAMWSVMKDTAANIVTAFVNVGKAIAGIFSALWQGIKSKATGGEFWAPFQEEFASQMEGVDKGRPVGANAGKAFNDTFVGNMGADSPLKGTIDILTGDLSKIVDKMTAAREAVREQRTEEFNASGKGKLFEGLGNVLKSTMEPLVSSMKETFGPAISQLIGGVQGKLGFAAEMGGEIFDAAFKHKKEKGIEKPAFHALVDFSKHLQTNLVRQKEDVAQKQLLKVQQDALKSLEKIPAAIDALEKVTAKIVSGVWH